MGVWSRDRHDYTVDLLRISVTQDAPHAQTRFVLSCKAVNDCADINIYVTVDV